MPSAAPRVSLLIPLSDHAAIAEILSALAGQSLDMRRQEILFSAPPSEHARADAVMDAAHAHAPELPIRVLMAGKPGRAAALNAAISQSSGDIVLLLADDFVPCPRFVEAHLAFHHERPEPNEVGIGPAYFPPEVRGSAFCRWLEDSGRLFGVSFTRPRPELLPGFFWGANTSLKRAFLLDGGLFDEDFVHFTTDDYELGQRLFARGMRVGFVAEAAAMHQHPVTLRERCQAMRESGLSGRVFEAKRPRRRPLHAACERPAWRHRLAARCWAALHLLTRLPACQRRSWISAMDAALADGYRRGGSERQHHEAAAAGPRDATSAEGV